MTFSVIGGVVYIITTTLVTIGIPGLLALMVVESFGIPPVPSEVILPFAGFLVAEGTFPLGWTIAAALAGGLVGSYAGYAVGRWGRARITGIGIGRLRLESRHLERMDRFFSERGELTVAASRLVPVIRSYISYPAGTARMEPVRFGVYTLIGSTPYTLALLYAGFVLRSNWTLVSSEFRYFDFPVIVLVVLVALLLVLEVAGVLPPRWPPWRAVRLRRAVEESSPSGGSPPTR